MLNFVGYNQLYNLMPKKQYWSTTEKEMLRTMARDGKTFGEICAALPNRTPIAVLLEARYLSALETGITPQGLKSRREDQTKKLSQVYTERGKAWTPEDIKRLLFLFSSANSIDQICEALGRSRESITKRIKELCTDPTVDCSYGMLFEKIRRYLVFNKKVL